MNPLKKQQEEARRPTGERYDYNSLCLASNEELEVVMRMGTIPEPSDLAGWEFKGWNTNDITYLIFNKKFKKGFFKKAGGEKLMGYNVVVLQNHLGEPWIDKLKGSDSIRHGYFDVYPVKLNEIDCKYPNAILLNYGAPSENFILNPARLLRDYLVRVYPDNPDLYLGKAYTATGPIRMFQSFFILEKNNQSLL
jgi:hypothetical protein